MRINVKEITQSFEYDDRINTVVNGNCNHAITDIDELEPDIGPDSYYPVSRDVIVVCTKCDAWRYYSGAQWHDEKLLEIEPITTSMKLVLR